MSLRKDYLSPVESMAQTLGFMTPTGVLGVTIPLMIVSSGNASGLLFLLTLVIFFFLSVTINTFARRSVSAGSLATFVTMGLGKRWGGVAGWAYMVGLAYSASIAAVASADYLDIATARLTGMPSSLPRMIFFTTLVLLAAWWTAYRDVKLSTEMMLYIEALSLALMVFLLVFVVIKSKAWIDVSQLSMAGVHPLDLQPGFVFALTCLAGFESVLTLGEESKNALRSIPRVMLSCVLALGLFFFVVSYGLLAVWHNGFLTLKDFDDPFVVIAEKIHLPLLGLVSSFGVALSFFACTLASINAGSRVLFSLARNGDFWPAFSKVHPRNATPSRTIAAYSLFAGVSSLGFLLGGIDVGSTIDYLSCLLCFGFLTTYLLVSVAAPIYLHRAGVLEWRGAVGAALSLISISIVLIFNLYPLQPSPNRYYVLIFLGFLAVGTSISQLRPLEKADLSSDGTKPRQGMTKPNASLAVATCYAAMAVLAISINLMPVCLPLLSAGIGNSGHSEQGTIGKDCRRDFCWRGHEHFGDGSPGESLSRKVVYRRGMLPHLARSRTFGNVAILRRRPFWLSLFWVSVVARST